MPSSFQKKQKVPIPVSEGGTGVSSLPYGAVLVGAGTGNIGAVSPGTASNILKSDGTSWTSETPPTPTDGGINYQKIAKDMTQVVDLVLSNNIDWSLGAIYTKTLTGNTILNFSNYKLNKSIILKIAGDYSLVLPKTVKNMNGVYDGKVVNYIYLHCTKSTPAEEVWGSINQRSLSDYGYGYFAGGAIGSPPYVTNTDRIIFSTGVTSANTVSNLSQQIKSLAGLSDATTYGYFAGGITSNSIGVTTDRIIFSTGVTSTNTVSNLSQTRWGLTGLSDGSTYGYFAGGSYTGIPLTTTDRIVFSTGIISVNTASNLPQINYYMGSSSDGSTYGYFAGGSTWSGTMESLSSRIVFSTGITSANTVSNLSQARSDLAGLSDGATYGYFAGGDTTGTYAVVTTDRIVFSTGVTSVNTVSNLSLARYSLASSSDGSIYGYFAGGNSVGNVATTDRIVFSTGVTSTNTVSNLSVARYSLAGLSSCAV